MNGIQAYSNLSNILLSGRNQINAVRLNQALSNNNKIGKPSSHKPVMSGISQEDSDFLKKYQGNMMDLKKLADEVLKGGEKSKLAAGSDNLNVAEVTGKLSSASDSYTLTVEQMASGQENHSVELDSNGSRPTMSGSLHIKTEKGSFDFYMSAAGSKNNREMLDKFAAQINKQKTGITASVEEKNGKASIRLTGASGESNSFEASGSLAERLGLDQVEKYGQDAVYTVQKKDGQAETYHSQTNSITIAAGLSANLRGTGTAKIEVGQGASSSTADSVSKLVDKYNETLKFLDKNADKGMGVYNQLKQMILPPTSEKSMEAIGITVRKDGTMVFDRAAFLNKMQESPKFAQQITERFAQGIRSDAQIGMQRRSGSLLDPAQYSQRMYDMQQDPLSLMNLYNRTGAYNMTNYYAVGAMMNLSI